MKPGSPCIILLMTLAISAAMLPLEANLSLSGGFVTENKPAGTKVGELKFSAPNPNGAVKVVASVGSSLCLMGDGSVWVWGDNSLGQLGLENLKSKIPPTKLIDSGAVNIDASFCVKEDGSLWGWGSVVTLAGKISGNLYNPPQKLVNSGVVSVTSTTSAVHFIKSDGSLWSFGANISWLLGTGTANMASWTYTPVKIINSGVKEVYSSSSHALCVKEDGSLWAWGQNNFGQLGDGNQGIASYAPKKIIDSGVRSASVAMFASYCVKDDGSLWEWGFSPNDHNIPTRTISSGVQSIDADALISSNTVFLKDDGTVWLNVYEPEKILDSGAIAVAAGASHNLIIKEDGSVWGSGYNGAGQLGVEDINTTDEPILILEPGGVGQNSTSYELVPGNGGSDNEYFRVEGNELLTNAPFDYETKTEYTIRVRAASGDQSSERIFTIHVLDVLENAPASRITLDNQSVRENKVPGTTVGSFAYNGKHIGKVVQVAAGTAHSLCLKEDGSVWAWGLNRTGQLGNGIAGPYYFPPVKVIEQGAVAIAAGNEHTLCLKENGSLWAWGGNNKGQLGNGNSGGRYTDFDEGVDTDAPIQVIESGVIAIAAGAYLSLCIMEDGSLWTWGLGVETVSLPKKLINSGVTGISS
jgi:hypothetical protein